MDMMLIEEDVKRDEETMDPELIGMDRELLDRINIVNLNFSKKIQSVIVHTIHDYMSDHKLHNVDGLSYVLDELDKSRKLYEMESEYKYPLEIVNDHQAIISRSEFKNGAEVIINLYNVQNYQMGLNFEIIDRYGDTMLSAPFDIIESAFPPFFGTQRLLYSKKDDLYEIYAVIAPEYEIREP